LQPAELPPLRLPAAKRLVAIGDLHGDLDKVCVENDKFFAKQKNAKKNTGLISLQSKKNAQR
jgi:hypothetical protein